MDKETKEATAVTVKTLEKIMETIDFINTRLELTEKNVEDILEILKQHNEILTEHRKTMESLTEIVESQNASVIKITDCVNMMKEFMTEPEKEETN